jgi:hypothetical protein
MTLLVWAVGFFGAAVAASGAVLVAIYVNLFFGVALALAAGGATTLVLAALQERRDRGTIHLRHCLECGASVADDAGFCPRCQSVRIQEAASSGATGATGRRDTGREMPVTAYSLDRSGVIGWVDAAPPGLMGEAASAAKTLRRWGATLLVLAAIACVLGFVYGG